MIVRSTLIPTLNAIEQTLSMPKHTTKTIFLAYVFMTQMVIPSSLSSRTSSLVTDKLCSTQVIDPDGRPTALVSVSKLDEEMAIASTRIVSAFFDTSDGAPPALVNVAGSAVIGFKSDGVRKLLLVLLV